VAGGFHGGGTMEPGNTGCQRKHWKIHSHGRGGGASLAS
jgi:hypothetical protein